MSGLSRVWDRFFFTGGNAEQLGLLRILIGLGMIPFHVLQFKTLLKLDRDGPHFFFVEPIWYFPPLGIETLDPTACLVAFVILIASTLAFAFGFFTRSSLLIMLFSIIYLKGMRDSVAGDVHHRYLIPFTVLFFFLLSRCGDIWSLDALRARWRRRVIAPIEEWEASWPIKAGQLYVCSFYFWSAIAKARMSGLDWVQGGERIQALLLSRSARNGYENGVVVARSETAFLLAHYDWVGISLGAATYLFEFGFPLILFIHNTWLRLIFFSGVAFFHVANYYLISVKFLFLPIVFLLFFDVSVLLKTARDSLRRRTSAAPAA